MKCRSEKCIKISNFLERKEGTLDIIHEAPKSYPGFRRYIREIMQNQEKLFDNFVFKDDIKSAMMSGYTNALAGFLRSAEESNRFIIERSTLELLVRSTTDYYLRALKQREWHILVDNGYIIRSAGEGLGRIKKVIGRKIRLDSTTVYLMGIPVCKKHIKFIKYSIPIEDIQQKLRKSIKIKCKFCNRNADYFTLAMPKASALIGLAEDLSGKSTKNLMNIYSNISRILHPYGFVEIRKEAVFSLWARDFLNIMSEINNLFGFVNQSRSSSNNGKPSRELIDKRNSR
ncbi:hypothetical protein [Acidianus sp. RZ1]|uniref:hypothetical protein n=1 Tax=Acidianus sp. RZ1 TaxID=1540082 RepID=UPI001491766A|nr:hypothetical protein [Acidianus sp. RZ1]NON61849.1 hypothetical protein [Acidianus sp. RZ1]